MATLDRTVASNSDIYVARHDDLVGDFEVDNSGTYVLRIFHGTEARKCANNSSQALVMDRLPGDRLRPIHHTQEYAIRTRVAYLRRF